jgi:hypothetical protein
MFPDAGWILLHFMSIMKTIYIFDWSRLSHMILNKISYSPLNIVYILFKISKI